MNAGVLGLFTAAVFLTAGAANATTRLVVNCFWPPQHAMCIKILPHWLDEVERVTEGRVTGMIPSLSVAPAPEQLAAVEKGMVDAGVQFNGLIANRVTGALLAMNPFTGVDQAQPMTQAMWETNRKFFPDEFDTVELLAQWVVPPGLLFSTTDKPIVTLDDFRSRKLWALPGPVANMSSALGAGVVATPAVQSNEAISRGVVDGHFGLGGEAIRSFQVIPYTTSMTRFSTPVYTTTFSFFMNKDKWNEISPEDQAAIWSVSGEVLGMAAAQSWDTQTQAVFDSFAQEDIAVVDANPSLEAALHEAAVPIVEKWKADATAAGIDAEAALAFYRQRLADLTK